MKLLINALILQEHNTGLGVYTFNVLENIMPKLLANGLHVDILCKCKDYLPVNCREHCIEANHGNFIQRNMIVDRYATDEYDLLWSTTQHGSLKAKCPQIITVHDLTPLFYPKGRIHQYVYYRFFLKGLIKKAKSIITVSENTKKDICRVYGCDEKKIINAYTSIPTIRFNSVATKCEKHFSITGIHYPYKNIHLIIEAFHEYADLRDFKLYIIGNQNCEYGQYLQKLVKKYSLENNIIFTGFVSEEKKDAIIQSSTAAIYPSKYEGFGIPPLESMAVGVPVLVSNTSSLPEVGGDAPIYFDPDSTESFHKAFLKLINSDRNELIDKGFNNLKRFSWEKTTNILLETILEIGKAGL